MLLGCSDFFEPVESTPSPTEYTYNYWLLDRTYLYEDEIKDLDPEGDSVSQLYSKLSDRFTRYVAPSKSEATTIAINTSFVPGNIGIEYKNGGRPDYPLCISRVYPESPASRAGVPRYSCIKSVNDTLLHLDSYGTYSNISANYNSILSQTKNVKLEVLPYINSDTTLIFEMEKEDVYAPTVFVDTMTASDGTSAIVISIEGFKLTTLDREQGTYGELKTYLDSTRDIQTPRILNLVGNPGGHVNQCISMADLFIESGVISSRYWRSFNANGESVKNTQTNMAKSGDPGEGKDFIVLVNGGSASCAEIFTAAIQEGAGIPVVGKRTYGKGIGQSTWNTMEGGLAIITNLEFLTPKGNSYHKSGITPDVDCGNAALLDCAVETLYEKYGKKPLTSKSNFSAIPEFVTFSKKESSFGGAFIENQDPALDIFSGTKSIRE